MSKLQRHVFARQRVAAEARKQLKALSPTVALLEQLLAHKWRVYNDVLCWRAWADGRKRWRPRKDRPWPAPRSRTETRHIDRQFAAARDWLAVGGAVAFTPEGHIRLFRST